MIQVLIVDDQELFRESLKVVLGVSPGIRVVGAASGMVEALKCAAKRRPDVVLMDIRMPGMDGVEDTRLFKERYPNTKVIVLTTFDDDEYVFGALKHGASGYLLKGSSISELSNAIQVAWSGGTGPSWPSGRCRLGRSTRGRHYEEALGRASDGGVSGGLRPSLVGKTGGPHRDGPGIRCLRLLRPLPPAEVFDGGQYALPQESVPTIMFVNKTLLGTQGIPLPDNRWTWEDFYDICAQVTDVEQRRFGVYGSTWLNALYSNGASLFSEDGKSCFLADERIRAAVRFAGSLDALNGGYTVDSRDFSGAAGSGGRQRPESAEPHAGGPERSIFF